MLTLFVNSLESMNKIIPQCGIVFELFTKCNIKNICKWEFRYSVTFKIMIYRKQDHPGSPAT